jgi:hypothetical protein
MESSLKFESTYCLNLKNAYYGNQDLHSRYYPFLKTLLAHRCTDTSCYLSQYWNQTNQDGMTYSEFSSYLATSLYLFFPIFLFCILLFFFVGFIFCIYCNCCFCCCFSYDSKLRENRFFIRIIIVIAAVLLLYLGLSLFLQISFESFRLYTEYTLCQLNSVNIFQFLNGINMTDINNNNRPDPKINWSGLLYINDTFINYYTELTKFQNSIYNEVYLQENDAVSEYYTKLSSGINNFTEYINSNKFELQDRNYQLPGFNLNYKCFECANDTLFNASIAELNNNFVTWHKQMDDYRKTVYDLFVNSTRWEGEINKQHFETKTELRKVTYESYKFYNNVMTYYDDVQFAQKAARIIDYVSLSLLCFGLFMTIVGYRYIKNCIYH